MNYYQARCRIFNATCRIVKCCTMEIGWGQIVVVVIVAFLCVRIYVIAYKLEAISLLRVDATLQYMIVNYPMCQLFCGFIYYIGRLSIAASMAVTLKNVLDKNGTDDNNNGIESLLSV